MDELEGLKDLIIRIEGMLRSQRDTYAILREKCQQKGRIGDVKYFTGKIEVLDMTMHLLDVLYSVVEWERR